VLSRERSFTVLDWCEYGNNSNAAELFLGYSYRRRLKSLGVLQVVERIAAAGWPHNIEHCLVFEPKL